MILKKLSDERYLCRVYVPHLYIPSSQAYVISRHKQHIKHNLDPGSKVDAPVDDPTESSKIFYDIEMILDDQLYEGDLKDIKEGGFVSFRYTGTTFGPPVNPKVSQASPPLMFFWFGFSFFIWQERRKYSTVKK